MKYIAISIFILSITFQNTFSQTKIGGSFNGLNDGDSIELRVFDHFLLDQVVSIIPPRKIISVVKNGYFNFEVRDISDLTYVSLVIRKMDDRRFYYYLLEPHDNIFITIKNFDVVRKIDGSGKGYIADLGIRDIQFTGRGSAKWKYTYDILMKDREITNNALKKAFSSPKEQHSVRKSDSSLVFDLTGSQLKAKSYFDSLFHLKYYELEKYRNKLTTKSYLALKTDLIGKLEDAQLHELVMLLNENNYYKNVSTSLRDSISSKLKRDYMNRKRYNIDVNNPATIRSKEYIAYLAYENFYSDWIYLADGFEFITTKYKGVLKDKLISAYFLQRYQDLKNSEQQLQQSLSIVKTSFWWDLLSNMYNSQKIGTPAYSFELTDFNDNKVTLKDLKGKFVFVDFWFTGCGGCQIYYRSYLQKVEEKFRNNPNIIFVTITADKEKEIWKKSVQSNYYTSMAKNVINLYTDQRGIDHPVFRSFSVTAYPFLMMIDASGNIFKMDEFFTNRTELEEIITRILGEHKLL